MYAIKLGNEQLVVSDPVGDAVWAYHSALAASGRSAGIELPVAFEGTVSTCRLTIGWAAALTMLSLPGSTGGSLADDDAVVADLSARTSQIALFDSVAAASRPSRDGNGSHIAHR